MRNAIGNIRRWIAGVACLLLGLLVACSAPLPPVPPVDLSPVAISPTAVSSPAPDQPTAPPVLPSTTPVPDQPTAPPSPPLPPPTDTPAPIPTNTPPPPPATATQARAAATPPGTVGPGPHITVLATGYGTPDDVAVDPQDGTIYFGDFANRAVNRLAATGGTPEPVATGFNEPEGIVVLPDGRLIVMEQATNRLWTVTLPGGDKQLLLQLTNRTGQDGVDGIALDPQTGALLIPDSPNGRLLSLSLDGGTPQVLATGFTRPTGVAVLPGGDFLVADEFGNSLQRVTRAGRKSRVATLYQPDDVVVDSQGIAYANGLDGVIWRVDPATGAKQALLTGLILPHGLALHPDGGLIIAEAGRNRIFRLLP